MECSECPGSCLYLKPCPICSSGCDFCSNTGWIRDEFKFEMCALCSSLKHNILECENLCGKWFCRECLNRTGLIYDYVFCSKCEL